MWQSILTSVVLGTFITAGAWAAGDKPSDEAMADAQEKKESEAQAVINFADLPRRISSWRADGDQTLYLRVGVNDWYRADLRAPCIGLPFTENIGLVTDGLNRVDKFSSIVVDSGGGTPERCWFKSLTKVDGPPNKGEQSDD